MDKLTILMILLVSIAIVAVFCIGFYYAKFKSIHAQTVVNKKVKNMNLDGIYIEHRDEVLQLLKKQNLEYEKEISEQRRYFESLLEARKERDDEYDFIAGRYHNEANLRKSLEDEVRELFKVNSYLKGRLERVNKKYRVLLKRLRLQVNQPLIKRRANFCGK